MTTYTYTGPAPTDRSLRFIGNTGVSRSPLSGAIQTVSRPGSRWEMELIWKNLTYEKIAQVTGFFARLNGGEHRARLPLYGHVQSGAPAGSPLVDGASQVGNDLDFDTVAAITDYFKVGDFFAFDNGSYYELKQVTVDLTTTTGTNNVNFVPEIRISPANNQALIVAAASILSDWVLTSPVQQVAQRGNVDSEVRPLSDVRLTFVDEIA